MKKTLNTVFIAIGFLVGTTVMSQSVQEGVNHLYAERYQSAKNTFEKLLATNPNNIDAIYWLGQTSIAMDNIPAARSVYEKALVSNGNAPLLLAGMGHVELLENKVSNARQHFETAISISRGKKGDDPAVLNAIGRANIDAADNKYKSGDLQYAIEKLKLAAERDPKNPDIFLNLGNAYRKLQDGGNAVTNYNKALEINPNFAIASYRIAKIYETQKNWEPYLRELNNAIPKDPRFAPAYYELYYYNIGKLDFAQADQYAQKYIANTDPDIQNDYLRAQTEWARKNYDQAISIAKEIINKAGAQTKPRTYKLIAYSYVGKGDSVSAKQFIDEYFAKAKTEEIIGQDYILKADIYAGLPSADPNIVRDSYLKAAAMDSVLDKKIQLLQQGIDRFKIAGKKVASAELRTALYNLRPNPNPTELFNIGLDYYQGGEYLKADSIFKLYSKALPDSMYGYYWSARTNFVLDTTMSVEPYISNMVNGYQKTLDIVLATGRNKAQGITAAKFLAGYYNNIKKDKATAIAYLEKGLSLDPNDASIQELIAILSKPPAKQPPPKTPEKIKTKTKTGKPEAAVKKKALRNTKAAIVKK